MGKQPRRILIADSSAHFIDSVTGHPEASKYLFSICRSGNEVLKTLKQTPHDLVILDIMLPKMHGIEILQEIRGQEETKALGVIISSYNPMMQNYAAAIDGGADHFLIKPCDPEEVFQLIERYYAGQLKPEPFHQKKINHYEEASCYVPISHLHESYLRFWGTRGSNSVAGPDYVRYGGNTSCAEIRYGNDLVIFDAGTGIRRLGEVIMEEQLDRIHLVIGHTHWDHVTGFPFFQPIYKKHCEVTIWAPVGFEKSTKELFTHMLAYSYFPVRLDEMHAQFHFKELRDSTPFHVGEIEVEPHYANHPGPTYCFKITTPDCRLGYVTDNEMLPGYFGHPNEIGLNHPLLEQHLSMVDFFKGCDMLVHEAQYFPIEYPKKVGWGHSSISNTAVLFKHTGCREWICTHHDPSHTDEDLERKIDLHHDILFACDLHVHFQMAYDGLILPLV